MVLTQSNYTATTLSGDRGSEWVCWARGDQSEQSLPNSELRVQHAHTGQTSVSDRETRRRRILTEIRTGQDKSRDTTRPKSR